MAPSKEVAVVGSNAVVSIDPDQTLKACKALLSHIQKAAQQTAETSNKKNLLADEDDQDGLSAETPVWLTLTTKRHIADKARLQPGKIALPHPLNADESVSICLITADPQRAYKDIVASADFPEALRKRIGRVVDVTKLKAKFSQYEAQRKLYSEHDVFLGDDRIINRLPQILGKTFYKTTQKRPVPVVLQANKPKVDGKRGGKRTRTEGTVNARAPAQIAKEIEKAVGSALVSLGPTTNTSIRIGYAGWNSEQIAENVDAVASALVEKWVPQKWRNVKSIYIKGPETAALPIWLTDELWVDDKDVLADTEESKAKATANMGKKRKSLEGEESPAPKKAKKADAKKADAGKHKPHGDDDKLDKQIAERKAKLRSAKAKASKALA